MNILQQLEAEQVQKLVAARAVPPFQPGDTVRVSLRVVEGDRERIQAFEGVCIARKNAGINSNFTLRKISYGEGVERVFPLHSPRITAIEVVRRGLPGQDALGARLLTARTGDLDYMTLYIPNGKYVGHEDFPRKLEWLDALAEHLKARGVGHAIYYPVPLHLQECFRFLGHREGDFPVSEQAAREVISLPIYAELTAAQQERVVGEIAAFYAAGS